jgi:hypothetical protein
MFLLLLLLLLSLRLLLLTSSIATMHKHVYRVTSAVAVA